MNFTLSEEQVMLQDAVARFLLDNYSFEQRREMLAQGAAFSRPIWDALATSLCVMGAALPETCGGMGGGPIETMVIMEAIGRSLVIEPYLETAVIGGGILKRCAGERAAKLLSAIATGEAIIAYAGLEPAARYAHHIVSTTAVRDGGGWVLNGAKSVVAAAPVASHLIVSARTAGTERDRAGLSLFLIDAQAAGITAHDYALIDGRSAADLQLTNVRVPDDALIGSEGDALPLIEQVMDEATAAVCAEAVGAMRKLLEDTIAYTKQRRQFGQPLSSFQVLQHRMVDMYMALEQAVSAVFLATLKLDQGPDERAKAVSAAKVTIGKSARMIGQSAVQLHGGMGMTDELAVGHYFKRVTVIETQFGSVDHHLARYAALSRSAAA